MKRIAAIAVIALCMVSPALAEEVLYCTDTDVTGFQWDKQGNAERVKFKPSRFTVKVISETKRMIHWSWASDAWEYRCETRESTYRCNEAYGMAATSIIFGPISDYSRASNFGPGTKASAPNILVAYGTCTKF